jgi:mxaJ protein
MLAFLASRLAMNGRHLGCMCVLASVLALSAPNHAGAQPEALRVCADPNNLPFSHRSGEGLENRIADLLGAELGLPVEYTWHPQRIGFVRNTLHAWVPEEERYRCDLVLGLPSGFELTATTRPYYQSTYVLVYARGRGLDDIRTPEDLVALPEERRQALRIGVFDHSPATDWLLKYGLINQAVSFQMVSGDPEAYPGRMIEEGLVGGELDLAIIWGPIAGYFAKRLRSAELVLLPLRSERGVRFHYAISMGVRHGERDRIEMLERLLDRHGARIEAILEDYGVPLVDDDGAPLQVVREQD